MNGADSNTQLVIPANPEAFLLFDRADDDAVIACLRGEVLKVYVYAYPQAGGHVYGLSVMGAEACKRELAKVGEVIREDDLELMYQDPERAFIKAIASRWSVLRGQPDMKLDTTVELKNQVKFITRRNGSQEPDSFWLEKGGSKAMRNAILNLTPAGIKQQVIEMYKAQAQIVKMTPEVGDAMTHEAHAAFKEKDERDELVRNLKRRWRDDLGLGKSQVSAILKKKNLPEHLVSYDSDWSTVDVAIIRDLLTEAGA